MIEHAPHFGGNILARLGLGQVTWLSHGKPTHTGRSTAPYQATTHA